MTSHPDDVLPAPQSESSLPASEPAVSWALVQGLAQAALVLVDAIVAVVFGATADVGLILGGVHGVVGSSLALAGAIYTRNRTVTNATLRVLAQMAPPPEASFVTAATAPAELVDAVPVPVDLFDAHGDPIPVVDAAVEVHRLARFLLDTYPDRIGPSTSAVDVAIRLLDPAVHSVTVDDVVRGYLQGVVVDEELLAKMAAAIGARVSAGAKFSAGNRQRAAHAAAGALLRELRRRARTP